MIPQDNIANDVSIVSQFAALLHKSLSEDCFERQITCGMLFTMPADFQCLVSQFTALLITPSQQISLEGEYPMTWKTICSVADQLPAVAL